MNKILVAFLLLCVVGISLFYSFSSDDENRAKPHIQQKIEEFIANGEGSKTTDLCNIMLSCGSDKSGWHNYTSLYDKLFKERKNEKLTVFELGLGTNNEEIPSNMGIKGKPGASLFGWAKYFPNATIYGADIDKNILFSTSRITTFYCDQRSEQCIQAMFGNTELKDVKFDIMIDDGLHEFDANLIFLLNGISKLKEGGIFIIEDLNPTTRASFSNILTSLKTLLSLKFIGIVHLNMEYGPYDNAVLIIQK